MRGQHWGSDQGGTLMGRSLPDRVQTCVSDIAHMSVENDWSSCVETQLLSTAPLISQSSNTRIGHACPESRVLSQ